ncbi:xanthine dehydrogenase family protein molybdopterin-binding subunit [Methylovirgula sp. 4M-Z18]|uniref:xanthine dehydrogenase family protein molybdopterin-binding subunit n=1 Tax=Methylovirgula sp. 4M-Z18 TaxID=2293567 RepID=UPI000E2E6D35|nr:xanthine dehydrogenase family protein molybdopterin-binding subunit [Methylovirgula sp. 4M-Z18]RFB80783.1 xanthine dehydrogenase family protein molybdopterin-binding subunit [Methylovirgula sp. 4M-Z18]
MNAPVFNRRSFVVACLSFAGGLAVGVSPLKALPIAGKPWSPESPEAQEVNAWVVIEPDGTILIRVAQSEMGEGIFTALPMIVAEELHCDWTKVKPEFASANRNLTGTPYNRMGTGGSGAVRRSREFLQQAGASARERLIAAAAQKFGAAPSECVARDGMVIHQASNRSLPYAELSGDAAKIRLPREPKIKTPDQFKLIGTAQNRLDVPVKVTGEAMFGIDTRLPDMVYAAVTACPVFGGTVKSFDEAAVKKRRGVLAVVPVDGGLAVVADNFWRAKEAALALSVEWDEGAAAKTSSEEFRKDYLAALDGPAATAKNTGDVAAGLNAALKKVEAVYEVPHLAHATMEPLNATVHWTPDRIDVWMGTQNPDASLQLAADVGGVAAENVFVHTCYLGGGFGRRAVNDELRQAVQVSKAMRKPVKLIWTREVDIRHDRYRPQAALRFRAGLNADGMPVAMDLRTAVGSITRSLGWGKVENGIENSAIEGLANTPYQCDALRVDCALKNTHVPVMFWRSVGSSQNAFAMESFIDELAYAAGKDPYLYRRALLSHRPDFLAVLDTLAQKSDWGTKLPQGSARGIAVHESFGTIVGEVAQVNVSKSGDIKVERVVAAVDCGHVVNPATVERQIESAVIYGLTAALYGEITIGDGAVKQGNFDDYQMVRMADSPAIETHLVLSGGSKWGGIGEPGTPPIAPAVANAIFAATGKRIRSLPIKNQNLGV